MHSQVMARLHRHPKVPRRRVQIEVKNPNGICKGVKSVVVDGKKIAGNVIPHEGGKKTVKVEITLEG